MIKPTKITLFGSNSILLVWDANINLAISKEIIALNRLLKTEFSKEIVATNFAYHELALYLNNETNESELISSIEKFINNLSTKIESENSTIFKIPVCYDESFGWDIDEVCKTKDLKIEKLIEIHTKPIYPVHFIGFLPGFPYLGGLDKKIATPRKSTPRQKILAGAVGIAGSQTGIYTIDSPGGWNIIGRTPLKLFDVQQENPVLLQPGNSIKFESINLATYSEITKKIEKGSYSIKKYKNND